MLWSDIKAVLVAQNPSEMRTPAVVRRIVQLFDGKRKDEGEDTFSRSERGQCGCCTYRWMSGG